MHENSKPCPVIYLHIFFYDCKIIYNFPIFILFLLIFYTKLMFTKISQNFFDAIWKGAICIEIISDFFVWLFLLSDNINVLDMSRIISVGCLSKLTYIECFIM